MTQAISDTHLAEYHKHGYTVVERFFSGDQLTRCRDEIEQLLAVSEPDERSHVEHTFPLGVASVMSRSFKGISAVDKDIHTDALNATFVDEHLLDFARQVIGVEHPLMVFGYLRAKYPGGAFDQPLHRDIDNTYVVPREDPRHHHLQAFVYWDDVTEELGPTTVVSEAAGKGAPPVLGRDRDHLSRFFGARPFDDNALRPDLYDAEHKVLVPAGSVLLYSMNTLHRGTHFAAPHGRRAVTHMAFRNPANNWQGIDGYGRRTFDPLMVRFLTGATPQQRTAIGFPSVDSDYWTAETLLGVAERYPEMDMSPYRTAPSPA
ncbi:phytanoyl-CoA dioxygenase family protein [Embleya sp. NPDC005575]|uniref:phytanoyl-CoA dioxygenase family protein n=1 Tax=Embleya sp. NPDC005575 TaxID=3156892 RepID=UPI0033B6C93B